MQLYINPPSPYARKVVVIAHELGLADEIKILTFDPWKDPEVLIAATPLCKVPALITNDGSLFVESGTICEYLLENAGRQLTLDSKRRLDTMRRAAIAHGMMDAAFISVIEKRRPAEKHWQEWIDRQRRALTRTLPTLDVPPADRFDLGDITLACTLAYLDYRLTDFNWRNRRADLAAWLDHVYSRPSMIASNP